MVTIPDGKTVVVGGLKRSQPKAIPSPGCPLLTEHIPILRELTSLHHRIQDTTTSFFLFIRPKILRDSRFRDLRYLIRHVDVQHAEIDGDDSPKWSAIDSMS